MITRLRELDPRLKWIPLGIYLLAILVVLWMPSGGGFRPPLLSNDKVAHALMFTAFSALLWWAYPSDGWDRIAWACAGGFFLGFVTELGQIWVPGRLYEWADLAADWFGVVLGLSPMMFKAIEQTARRRASQMRGP